MEKTADKVVPRLVVLQPAYRLEDVKFDYRLTPKQAVELLPGSNTDIALWPEDKLDLWNGGQTGIVERANLPIIWPGRSFSTAEGRREQEASGIGFAWPVEIASLLLPENEPERIRKELNSMGVWWLVALRRSNEELWRHGGYFRPFYLCLIRDYFKFNLGNAGNDWGGCRALVGAPQVP